jgi:hypothetical protein
MKNLIKRTGIIAMIVFLSVACSNSTNSTKINSSEKKESFSENKMVKLFSSYSVFEFPNDKNYYSKNEYDSIDELMRKTFGNWEPLNSNKSEFKAEMKSIKKIIQKAEAMSKSKFFLQKGEYNMPEYIYFTPKDDTGYDICKIYIGLSITHMSTEMDKISIRDYVKETSLYVLHSDMRSDVDVKSLSLDPATTEKLLEAQNYTGL